MHLLIPFASALSVAAEHVLRDLSLPNLAKLLALLTPVHRDDGDPFSFSPPHERALAAAAGWHGADGCLPFAAQAAARDGIAVGELAWGLVTPTHWSVGRDRVTLADPAALNLTESDSRAAFGAVRELFESEAFRFEWGGLSRWYAAHECLAHLPCASLDRVIGRNLEVWMRSGADTDVKLIRRLQSEVQLLLYPHPLNDDREQRGELALNSFWLSGCGRSQADRAATVHVNESLRAPLFAEDWVAWADAWRAIDAGDVSEWLDAARAGRKVVLTLCGERAAQRFETVPRNPWQTLANRLKTVEPHRLLETL